MKILKSVEGGKYAVVFGIDSPTKSSWVGGDCDARRMKGILRDAGFTNKNIYFRVNSRATRAEWLKAFDWLKSVEDESSTVIIFYSGHGGVNGIGAWDVGITEAELASILSDLESQKQAMLIQQCGAETIIDALEAPNRLIIAVTSSGNRWGTVWSTTFLKQAIIEGKADVDGNGKVSLQEAFYYRELGVMSDNYGQPFYLGD